MTNAVSVSSFIESIGVNTSVAATWSDYGNFSNVEYDLSFLGISNVRDSYQDSGDVYRFQQLYVQLGVEFDFYLGSSSNGVGWEIAQIMADPSIVKLVEGQNESDDTPITYDSLTGLAATYAAQAALYTAITTDPALNNATRTTPVIQASFAQVASFYSTGNWSSVSNYGNSHEYFDSGLPPGSNIAAYLSMAQAVSPGEKVIATEGGYYTMPSGAGVDQLVQAKYDLTLLFDDFQAGIPMTYLFELLDEYSDPGNTNMEDHFGLFDSSGDPKTAAIALHNLVSLLSDTGTSAATGSLNYSLTGMPTSAHSMLMEKSNGTFVLALWNDATLWNAATESEIQVAPVPVTLSLGQSFRYINIYDPLTGVTSTASYSNLSQLSVNVLDHPILVTLSNTAPAQLSLTEVVVTELTQSGQPTNNLWADIMASVQESNSAYASNLTIQSVNTTGTMGSVALDSATDTLVYTAAAYNPNATMDSFGYTVSDGHGGVVNGTVRVVTAQPPSTTYGLLPGGTYYAPSSGWTLYSEASGQKLIGSTPGHDTFYGQGDTTIAAYGTGNLIATLAGNHLIDTGSGGSTVDVGDGNDEIFGSGSGDAIYGGTGNTVVMGETGNTTVDLGDGNHTIGLTGAGNTISVGVGSSAITAGAGGYENVTVAGGTSQITVGGYYNDVHVEAGTNSIGSTGGLSTFQLDSGTNSLDASGAGNTITGGTTNATIWGSTSNTTVSLGNGNDQISLGGAGNSVSVGTGTNLIAAGYGGSETVSIGGGTAQVSLGGSGNSVTLWAGSTAVSAASSSGSTYRSVSGNNTINVQGSGNTLIGGSGEDALVDLSGGNVFSSGSGTNQMEFAGSSNVIMVGQGATTLNDSGSSNTIQLAANPSAPTQIYGAVTANGDTFDLRTLLASTDWDGNTSQLSSFLAMQSSGSDSILWVDPTATAGGSSYAAADLHGAGVVSLSQFLAHAIT